MALARAGEPRLVDRRRGRGRARPPSRRSAGARPPARSQTDAATTPPPRVTRAISRSPATGSGHEVDDELRERRVERVLVERQALGRRVCDAHAGIAASRAASTKRLRGIDCRDAVGADACDELGRRALRGRSRRRARADLRPRPRGRRAAARGRGVPPHEAVVGLGGDLEAHRRHSMGGRASGHTSVRAAVDKAPRTPSSPDLTDETSRGRRSELGDLMTQSLAEIDCAVTASHGSSSAASESSAPAGSPAPSSARRPDRHRPPRLPARPRPAPSASLTRVRFSDCPSRGGRAPARDADRRPLRSLR